MAVFDRPIPGQSLTKEPGNAPYERPPEITDPEEALMMHLERLNDVDTLEAAMLMLDNGAAVKGLASGVLRAAVMNGMHSVDVSLIIREPIEEFIAGTAKELGIDFKTGYEKEDRSMMRERHANLKAMEGISEEDLQITKSASKIKAEAETMAVEEQQEEPMVEEEIQVEEPKGLMARA